LLTFCGDTLCSTFIATHFAQDFVCNRPGCCGQKVTAFVNHCKQAVQFLNYLLNSRSHTTATNKILVLKAKYLSSDHQLCHLSVCPPGLPFARPDVSRLQTEGFYLNFVLETDTKMYQEESKVRQNISSFKDNERGFTRICRFLQ
jgi:hypothetical protein